MHVSRVNQPLEITLFPEDFIKLNTAHDQSASVSKSSQCISHLTGVAIVRRLFQTSRKFAEIT